MILNSSQERAVKNHGHQLILAGPGSGKTRVITEKILHLIDQGVRPDQILALTFSEKAAKEMLERLEVQTETHELTISTFHSFCNSILEDNVLDSGISFSSGIISRANQLVWGLRNIDNFGFEYIEVGNNAADVIESMIDGISAFRDELITPEDLEEYIRKKRETELGPEEEDTIGKLSDLLNLYKAYELYKRSEMLLDFDDMIHEAVQLFDRKPLVLNRYRNRFRYILVDEFQDTNYAQLFLIKQIAGENVCVVGDDDQTIYRFRGAYLTNFLDFKEHFKLVDEVLLDNNYRNSATILSLALQLMCQAPNRTVKALITGNPEGEPAKAVWCENEKSEAQFVLEEVQKLLKTPFFSKKDKVERLYQPKDIAIICRKRFDGIKIFQILKRNGIPAEFVGEVDIFSTASVRDVVACLKVINNPLIAGISLNRIMKVTGIPETVVQKINSAARDISYRVNGNDGVFEAMLDAGRIVPDHAILIGEIIASLQRLIDMKDRVLLSELVHSVTMEGTGAYARAIDEDEGASIAVLNKFQEITRDYEAITKEPTLPDFLDYITLLSGVTLDVSAKEDENVVQILTAHRSKGKEFPAVFVVDMVAKKFPLDFRKKKFQVPNDLSRGLKTTDDEKALFLQEERRLCYVAMTRAEERLYFTLARWYGELKTEKKPSRFLQELDFEHNPLIDVIDFAATSDSKKQEISTTTEGYQWQLQEQARNAISQMQLHIAVQRLVELEKVRLLTEGKPLSAFDPATFFLYSTDDSKLARLLAGEKEKIVPDSLRFSSSSLSTYEACPLKFKFQYILLIPGIQKSFFSLGTAVHSTIEELSRLQGSGEQINLDIALKILPQFWQPRAYDSRKQEDEDLTKARTLLETYLAWQMENKNTIIGIEKEFKFNFEEHPVKGYIDRLEQTSDGAICVVDFKTGRKPSELTKKSIREDFQMNLYCLGVREMFGKIPVKASLFYLKDNKLVDYIPDNESINAFTERMSTLIKSIHAEQFVACPGQACRYCDYGSLCDSQEKDLEG
jgi:DNA helicase-2/ATP-dependent DNA helicase PcrA